MKIYRVVKFAHDTSCAVHGTGDARPLATLRDYKDWNCGYDGAGPRALALCIAADYCDERPSGQQLFTGDCLTWQAHHSIQRLVARLSFETGGDITEEQIERELRRDGYYRRGREMTEQEVEEMLNELAGVHAAQTAVRLQTQRQQAELLDLVPETQRRLAELEVGAADRLAVLAETETQLREAVKAAVLEVGHTVSGIRLQAVWQKGRVSWDTKTLEGFSEAYLEIKRFRQEGEPSVSIREVKQ